MNRKRVLAIVLGSIFGAFTIAIIFIVLGAFSS